MAPRTKNTDKTKPAADRADRLKAALKANMAKRKAQARARAAATGDEASDTGENEG